MVCSHWPTLRTIPRSTTIIMGSTVICRALHTAPRHCHWSHWLLLITLLVSLHISFLVSLSVNIPLRPPMMDSPLYRTCKWTYTQLYCRFSFRLGNPFCQSYTRRMCRSPYVQVSSLPWLSYVKLSDCNKNGSYCSSLYEYNLENSSHSFHGQGTF